MLILEILREKHGYTGGYTTVQEYVQQLRNPDAAKAYRQTRSERYGKKKSKPAVAGEAVKSPILHKVEAPFLQTPKVLFRRSLRAPKRREPEPVDVAFAWMRSLPQGSTPNGVLHDDWQTSWKPS